VWDFLRPFLEGYDAVIFTVEEFVPPDFPLERVEIIPPAIDPESPKNMDLEPETVRRVLEWIGVEVERPLLTHVSRFDPWKDPLGVIETHRLVREEAPGLSSRLSARWHSARRGREPSAPMPAARSRKARAGKRCATSACVPRRRSASRTRSPDSAGSKR
jgi:hypothetical protein